MTVNAINNSGRKAILHRDKAAATEDRVVRVVTGRVADTVARVVKVDTDHGATRAGKPVRMAIAKVEMHGPWAGSGILAGGKGSMGRRSAEAATWPMRKSLTRVDKICFFVEGINTFNPRRKS